MIRNHRNFLHDMAKFCALMLLALLVPAQAMAQTKTLTPPPIVHTKATTVTAKNGMVVSDEALATHIGVEVLERGGNAIDAAVAVGFALAVTYPQAGNIGGGGFMMVHLADGRIVAIDYRETAPFALKKDAFLDARGEADPKKSREHGLAVGVPGTVAGLSYALEKYGSGKFSLSDLLQPAIKLARDGFRVSEPLADSLEGSRDTLARWDSSKKIFFGADGAVPKPGTMLVQKDLANTLETIAREGPKGFYQGEVAEKIARAVDAAGGVMTTEDLAQYEAVERKPVRGTYHEYDIVSMPPPSSGGVHLIQILNILDGFDLGPLGPANGQAAHIRVEAMKLAYADRAQYLGDPDYTRVPVEGLISKEYAAALRRQIDPDHAKPAKEIKPGNPIPFESDHTTHYSIVDKDGNAVANTYTLNLRYGIGLAAEGTGVLLNNELDDFAAKKGAPNAFGLVGGEANAPGPGKRPLSSMTPTFVLKGGKLVLVTGSPGGSRIITTVANVIINFADYKMSLADAVAAPRIHHQWMPDEVRVEPDLPPDTAWLLERRGNKVVPAPPWGAAHSILVTGKELQGVADPRAAGAKAEGY
jgi:gamma-glutamyltranspeptidase/glutathione hydrolase